MLDRVNPIRGDRIEGPAAVVKKEIVACHDIPLMHGMTAGELAILFNAESQLHARLVVVKAQQILSHITMLVDYLMTLSSNLSNRFAHYSKMKYVMLDYQWGYLRK